jgi:hypothetical protein
MPYHRKTRTHANAISNTQAEQEAQQHIEQRLFIENGISAFQETGLSRQEAEKAFYVHVHRVASYQKAAAQ